MQTSDYQRLMIPWRWLLLVWLTMQATPIAADIGGADVIVHDQLLVG